MAITTFRLITFEEYDTWDGKDSYLENENSLVLNQTNYINEAIATATDQLDMISGGRLNMEFDLLDEENDKKRINLVKLACCLQVRFLLRKGIEYTNNEGSMSAGSINYTLGGEDTFTPRPDVVAKLKLAGFYTDIVYLHDKPEGQSLNNGNRFGLNPIYRDGTYGCPTYQQADARYIKKETALISQTGTIKITPWVDTPDGGRWSIDITEKEIKAITEKVIAQITPEEIVDKVIEKIKPIIKEQVDQVKEQVDQVSLKLDSYISNKVWKRVKIIEDEKFGYQFAPEELIDMDKYYYNVYLVIKNNSSGFFASGTNLISFASSSTQTLLCASNSDIFKAGFDLKNGVNELSYLGKTTKEYNGNVLTSLIIYKNLI